MCDDRPPLNIVRAFMPDAASATTTGPYSECDDGSVWRPVEIGERKMGTRIDWQIYQEPRQ